MSALTPEQEQRVDSGIRAWEDNGGPILNHLVPVVAALIAEAVDQARAEERERIAERIAERLFSEARLHDAASTGFSGKGDTYAAAARIARSQP